MAEVYSKKNPNDVELSDLSEPNDPLLSSLQTPKLPSPCNKEDDTSFHNSPSSSTSSPKDDQSPTSQLTVCSNSSIPKNRKRPGSTSDSQRVMMTGMVTRGISVGQSVEVEVDLTETEFLRLTSRDTQQRSDKGLSCGCGGSQGPHITLWSILCIPIAMIISLCMAFYNGAVTWYSLIIYFSEEKSWIHKLTLCPLIILTFPLTVGLSSVILAMVASLMQISWSWHRWYSEFIDGEKGFYGWICSKIGLPNCSPYEVVVLDDTNV